MHAARLGVQLWGVGDTGGIRVGSVVLWADGLGVGVVV